MMNRISKSCTAKISNSRFGSPSLGLHSKKQFLYHAHNTSMRFFSQSLVQKSHPDFEPQRKAPQQSRARDFQEVIKKDIAENDAILYMKGNPTWPECGFSRAVVQILDMYGIKYASRNMNEDLEMKEALKVYSNWPTIPQFYVKGEFIGGCDIVMQMHKDGELEALLEGIARKEKKKRDLTENA